VYPASTETEAVTWSLVAVIPGDNFVNVALVPYEADLGFVGMVRRHTAGVDAEKLSTGTAISHHRPIGQHVISPTTLDDRCARHTGAARRVDKELAGSREADDVRF
jgi:hypothetical protein